MNKLNFIKKYLSIIIVFTLIIMPSINFFFKNTFYMYIPHLILGLFIITNVIYMFVTNIINDLEYMLNYKKKKNKNNIFYFCSFLLILLIYGPYFFLNDNSIKFLFLIPICIFFVIGLDENDEIFKYLEYFIIFLCVILIVEYFIISSFFFEQLALPNFNEVLTDFEISKSLVNGLFNTHKYFEYCSTINNCKTFTHYGNHFLFDLPTPYWRPASIYHSPAFFTQLLIFSIFITRNKIGFFTFIKVLAIVFSGSSAVILVFTYFILRNIMSPKNIILIFFFFVSALGFYFLYNDYFFSFNYNYTQLFTSYIIRIKWIISFLLSYQYIFYSLFIVILTSILFLKYRYFNRVELSKLPNINVFFFIGESIIVFLIIFMVHPDTFKSFFGILFISLTLIYLKNFLKNYK